ncbi:MAG: division/cell wall cluster transcriptional repressor MraZ [Bdellovibrionales bacterium]|nr:division/cell wall cluster transcriptional repressor MraZ [Bdellovibrionales bacterium]
MSNSDKKPGFFTGSPLSFRGNFTHSIDSKGRVNLPAEFRRVLADNDEGRIVLTNYISQGARCLEGFGLTGWNKFESKLREKSRFSSKLQQLENFYLSRAAELAVDGSGRILIPAYLKNYAGLEKEITFTSSINGFRIWDRRVWELTFEESEKALMEDPDLFAELDI